jgi:hypothetical protein
MRGITFLLLKSARLLHPDWIGDLIYIAEFFGRKSVRNIFFSGQNARPRRFNRRPPGLCLHFSRKHKTDFFDPIPAPCRATGATSSK